MQTFIPFPEARRLVLAHAPLLNPEVVAFDGALGRILADTVVSREDIPPFDNSAMDGFAVRSMDLARPGLELPIASTIAAGGGMPDPLPDGCCARIMTGAPIPPGADAAIPVERTELDGDRVRFEVAAERGSNVRLAGANVRTGDAVIDAGIRITPPVIGMLATLGIAEVRVARRPRVAVISTGDELVDASETPGPSQIRDANGPTLAAQITISGGIVDGPHRVGDDPKRLESALDHARARADALVLSGGVSMGEFDYVGQVLESVGMEPIFWKVRQRPGKPLLFGVIDQVPVFGLPGNPVSASVCFEQYVGPALATMQGAAAEPRMAAAILEEGISKKPGLHHFVRGVLRHSDEGLHVRPTGPQGSHISRSLVLADCFIHLPEDWEDVAAGTRVDVERMRWV